MNRFGNVSFLLSLLSCGGDDASNAPPVGSTAPTSVGSASSPTTGVNPTTTTDSSSSSTTDDGTTGSDTTGSQGTGPAVETGSNTPCGDWAETFVQCVGPQMSVAEAEADCEGELVDFEEYGIACRNAIEERFACLSNLPCQEFTDWEINDARPLACELEFLAVDGQCPFAGTTT